MTDAIRKLEQELAETREMMDNPDYANHQAWLEDIEFRILLRLQEEHEKAGK